MWRMTHVLIAVVLTASLSGLSLVAATASEDDKSSTIRISDMRSDQTIRVFGDGRGASATKSERDALGKADILSARVVLRRRGVKPYLKATLHVADVVRDGRTKQAFGFLVGGKHGYAFTRTTRARRAPSVTTFAVDDERTVSSTRRCRSADIRIGYRSEVVTIKVPLRCLAAVGLFAGRVQPISTTRHHHGRNSTAVDRTASTRRLDLTPEVGGGWGLP